MLLYYDLSFYFYFNSFTPRTFRSRSADSTNTYVCSTFLFGLNSNCLFAASYFLSHKILFEFLISRYLNLIFTYIRLLFPGYFYLFIRLSFCFYRCNLGNRRRAINCIIIRWNTPFYLISACNVIAVTIYFNIICSSCAVVYSLQNVTTYINGDIVAVMSASQLIEIFGKGNSIYSHLKPIVASLRR